MTIKKTLESFDDGRVEKSIDGKQERWIREQSPKEIKDFIKESIIQAVEEITPRFNYDEKGLAEFEKLLERVEDVHSYDRGRQDVIDQLEKAKTKFLNN